MLTKILILSISVFSVIYPLCFWLSFKDPLKNGFHHFHLGLPTVTAALTFASFIFLKFPDDIILSCGLWALALLILSAASWKRETVNIFAVSACSLLGLVTFLQLNHLLFGKDWSAFGTNLVGGGIFCASLYAMNLGHWYLNVHGLSLTHLRNSVHALTCLLILRLMWDLSMLVTGNVNYGGEALPLVKFMMNLDGFLTLIAILFGTLFPLVSVFFAYGTLKLKNTQATTGILYVILSAILIGDITYKYYLIKFGVSL